MRLLDWGNSVMAKAISRIVFAVGIAAFVSAVPVSAVLAAWGCGATDGTATGRSWGFRNHTAASYRALAECTQRSRRGGCRVVGCSSSINTYYDAHVAWFNAAPTRALVERPAAHIARNSVRGSTTAANGDRCGGAQARCAIEVGGHCNPRTGFWCVGPGHIGNSYCGGNNIAWLACLDRVREK